MALGPDSEQGPATGGTLPRGGTVLSLASAPALAHAAGLTAVGRRRRTWKPTKDLDVPVFTWHHVNDEAMLIIIL